MQLMQAYFASYSIAPSWDNCSRGMKQTQSVAGALVRILLCSRLPYTGGPTLSRQAVLVLVEYSCVRRYDRDSSVLFN